MKVNYYLDCYGFFLTKYPELNNKTVLDYGSNYGMFLDSSGGKFSHDQYTGLDVDLNALNEGKRLFPTATWIHYNGFNSMYNPDGDSLLPVLPKTYQAIISYSVFTHTTQEDFIKKINWLYTYLERDGVMLISYCNTVNRRAVEFFTNGQNTDQVLDSLKDLDYAYLQASGRVKTPDPGKIMFSFFSDEFIYREFSQYNIDIDRSVNNVRNCFNDCLIIYKN